MHVPIGRSGVHAVPKTLHSHGLMTPLSTSPHWHAFGSATRISTNPAARRIDFQVPRFGAARCGAGAAFPGCRDWREVYFRLCARIRARGTVGRDFS